MKLRHSSGEYTIRRKSAVQNADSVGWCVCAGWVRRPRHTDSKRPWCVVPVARTAPNGTHDDCVQARARRRAAVRTGRPDRCWSQPTLRYEERDLTLHLPTGRRRHWRHSCGLSAHQLLWRNFKSSDKQIQPWNENWLGYILLAAAGFHWL